MLPVEHDLPGVAVVVGEVPAVAHRQLRPGLEQRAARHDGLGQACFDRLLRLDVDGERDAAERAARRTGDPYAVVQAQPVTYPNTNWQMRSWRWADLGRLNLTYGRDCPNPPCPLGGGQ